MRANIKLHLWVPFLFILVVAFFLMQEFNVLDIVMILGGIVIVGYFVMGIIRRKDALIIEEDTLQVTTPISKKEYTISTISHLQFSVKDKRMIQGTINGEIVNLIGDIYDVSIVDIYAYLISHYGTLTVPKDEAL